VAGQQGAQNAAFSVSRQSFFGLFDLAVLHATKLLLTLAKFYRNYLPQCGKSRTKRCKT
jgi:hypothetical protein